MYGIVFLRGVLYIFRERAVSEGLARVRGMGQGGREVTDSAETDGRECEEGGVSVFVLMSSLPRWELGRILSIFVCHSS